MVSRQSPCVGIASLVNHLFIIYEKLHEEEQRENFASLVDQTDGPNVSRG